MSVTREKLFEEVWVEPMTTVAKRYGVSSNYLARVCERLNVPRPGRGYWARLEVGKRLPRPELPPAGPEHELDWSRERDHQWYAPRPPLKAAVSPVETALASRPRGGTHALLLGAEALFTDSRETHEGKYLRPKKRLVPDLWVTKAALPRALKVANALFKRLDAAGLKVVIAPPHQHLHHKAADERSARGKERVYFRGWNPERPTVAFSGSVAFGLTLFEISAEVEVQWINGKYEPVRRGRPQTVVPGQYTWTHHETQGSGRLGLHVYSPYPGVDWEKYWRETEGGALARHFDEVAAELLKAAPDIARRVEEHERYLEQERKRQEAEYAEYKRQELVRRKGVAAKQSREQLLAIMGEWSQAVRIEQFLQELKNHLSAGADDARRANLQERLEIARGFFAEPDAAEYLIRWKTPDEWIPSVYRPAYSRSGVALSGRERGAGIATSSLRRRKIRKQRRNH